MTTLVDALRNFTLFRWIGIAMPVLGALSFLGGIWWNSNADRILNEVWYREDREWNGEILDGLSDIKQQLVDIHERQTLMEKRLTGLESTLAQQGWQRETRVAELTDEHQRIIEALYESVADMGVLLGRHEARHEAD